MLTTVIVPLSKCSANAVALWRYKACSSSRYANDAVLHVVDGDAHYSRGCFGTASLPAVCDYNERQLNSLDISSTSLNLVY